MATNREANGMDDKTLGCYREGRGSLATSACTKPFPSEGTLAGSSPCRPDQGSVIPGNTHKGHPIQKGAAPEQRAKARRGLAAPQLSASDLCFTRRPSLPQKGLRDPRGTCMYFQTKTQSPLVSTQDRAFLLSIFRLLKSLYPSSIVLPTGTESPPCQVGTTAVCLEHRFIDMLKCDTS